MIEIRSGYYCELLCQKPLEQWQMTRSFESMKMEYDLLHCHEFTDTQIIEFAHALQKNKSNKIFYLVPLTIFISILIKICLHLKS